MSWTPSDGEHIHVVGVAGVGMSALAQALLDRGFRVSGSDRYLDQQQQVEMLDTLRLAGVKLTPQDGSGVGDDCSCIAVSTAIEEDNPDLLAARKKSIPVVHRAELLARLTVGKHLLAVTGTAGKTTVTGMLGHICAEGGFDPVVVNGGVVNNWREEDRVGSVRHGAGQLMIIEADESDRSLLKFAPDYAVITNISKDHFELEEVEQLFAAFAAKTKNWVLSGAPLATEISISGRSMTLDGDAYPLPMPGRHNAENAAIAIRAARKLGVAPDVIARALSTFRGIHRRLEVAARSGGVVVLDDYAHNPAKIAASWRAAAEDAERVLGIWRPHGYGPLALLFDELVAALKSVMRPQDKFFVLPVYYAGGTAQKTNDAQRLAETLAAHHREAEFIADYPTLKKRLQSLARPGDVILGMGARDPELPVFLRRLM